MKKLYLLALLSLFTLSLAKAQGKLIFNDDDAGNQVKRSYVCTSCTFVPPPIAQIEIDFKTYPNPTSGLITAEWPIEYQGNILAIMVTSLDYTYYKMYSISYLQDKVTIDLTAQPAGIYLVNLYLKGGTNLSRKIIKL